MNNIIFDDSLVLSEMQDVVVCMTENLDISRTSKSLKNLVDKVYKIGYMQGKAGESTEILCKMKPLISELQDRNVIQKLRLMDYGVL